MSQPPARPAPPDAPGVVFLDVDGVLNDHGKHPGSHYTRVLPRCVRYLNLILKGTGADLVVSSAWRYMIVPGVMDLRGFEYLLRSHGLVGSRVVGRTAPDEDVAGRGAQIRDWVYRREPPRWVVLDDLGDAQMQSVAARLVLTDGRLGLTEADVVKALRLWEGQP